ncbi:MAG: hypothetical protein HYT93_03495 [Parcubacteria group bacterium]|nr:hypothetical protein [Parcubacteria group bacterium]
MKNIFIWIVVVLAVLIGGFYVLNSYIYNEKQGDGLPQDFKEVTFTISGEPVTLKDGVAEAYTALGGDSKTIVRYFGNEVTHDIDGDGAEDVVFLITQETGGSGTFFYAVGALKREEGGYIGSRAVYLGDRIAPQTTERGEGRIVIVNYADRAPGEPMTARPSVGKSLYLLLDPKTLEFGEVVQNFEGESR